MRRLAAAVGLPLAGILAGAAILELILRLGWIDNREYLRLQVHGSRPQDATQRVLLVGDSFLMPATHLAQLLTGELVRPGTAVLNLSRGGTGPFEYLEAVRDALTSFRPNRILLTYYVGNDLTNVQNHPLAGDLQDGETPPPVGINRLAALPVLRRSYLYQSLLRWLQKERAKRVEITGAESAGVAADLVTAARQLEINPWLVAMGKSDPGNLRDNLEIDSERNRRAWRRAEGLLEEIGSLCRPPECRLAIVSFPHTLQVSDSHLGFLRALGFDVDSDLGKSTRPQDLLRELCATQAIPYLDLLPAFRGDRGALYLERDDHLNARGERLSAGEMADFARRQLLDDEGEK